MCKWQKCKLKTRNTEKMGINKNLEEFPSKHWPMTGLHSLIRQNLCKKTADLKHIKWRQKFGLVEYFTSTDNIGAHV